MSLAVKCPAVKCPAVKCHLRSNVPRSNVSCGQMSHRPSVVKCPLWSNVITPLRGQMSIAVYCPAVKCPRSNVQWSNETVVIGDPICFSINSLTDSTFIFFWRLFFHFFIFNSFLTFFQLFPKIILPAFMK